MINHAHLSKMSNVVFLAILLASPVLAQTPVCTLADAVYVQPGADWMLTFAPTLRDAPSNQHNAFTIAMPGGAAIAGGVYAPNGFGGRWGTMHIGCPDGGDAPGCNLWEGTVYQVDAGGVSELHDQDTPAPAQILFPDFARTLWYAVHPDIDLRDSVPADMFTLKGCA